MVDDILMKCYRPQTYLGPVKSYEGILMCENNGQNLFDVAHLIDS